MAPENRGATVAAATSIFNSAQRNGSELLVNTLEMFKKYDVKGRGFIARSTFIQVLERIDLPDVEWLLEASQILEDDEGNVDYNGFVRWILFEDDTSLAKGLTSKPKISLFGPPLQDTETLPVSMTDELQDIAVSLISMALSLDSTHLAIANNLRKHAGTLRTLCGCSPRHASGPLDSPDLVPGTPMSVPPCQEPGDEFDALARHRHNSFLRQKTTEAVETGGFREHAAEILVKTGAEGSMVDDLQEVSVAEVQDKLAISYWRFCSGLRVYRSETVTKALRLICSAPVPGLGETSYMNVFQTLTESAAWENHIYLFGGLVRDILRRTVGNDIDISFSAPAAELAETCTRHGYTCSLDGDYILIGDEKGEEYLEGMVISFNGIQPPEHADFSMNTLFYDFKNDILIDKTGIGIPAITANRCDLPCPCDRWKSWIEINGVRVCFRYYKFLLRGHEYKEDEFIFVVKTLLQFWTQQEEHTVEVGRIALGKLVSSESAEKIEKLRQLVVDSYDMASGAGVIRQASIRRSRSKMTPEQTSVTSAACSFISGSSWWQQGWLPLLKLSPQNLRA